MLQDLPEDTRSLLALAAAQADVCGARVWLVGGVVRDLLLGAPPSRDIDLAVEGEVGALAAGLAAATGGRVTAAHAAFGTATVVAPGGPGRGPLVVDLARTRRERYPRPAALPEVTPAPIEDDLIRRDFSVNAMALGLGLVGGLLTPGPLLDPFGGRADLEAGLLRLLHGDSLRDDPTRLLRGARLAARLGLALEPGSRAQLDLALAASYPGMLTPERVLGELCLALEEPRPDLVLRVADGWGVTPHLLPGVRHSRALAERCARLAADGAGDSLVWAGLLLYDVDEMGLAAIMARYPLPSEAAAPLRQLAPLRALAPALARRAPNSAIDRMLRPYGVAALRVLHYAEPAAAETIAHYLSALRPARAPLDGNDLRRLGVAPGPELGRLLEELRAATLDGLVGSRAEAEAWLLTRMGRGG